jgi:hypothetical protein
MVTPSRPIRNRRQTGDRPLLRPRKQDSIMAKAQKRSTRELRKPKAAKVKPAVALAPNDNAQFKNAVRDPKAKH